MYVIIKLIDLIDYLKELIYYLTHEYLLHAWISFIILFISTLIFCCLAKVTEGKHARDQKHKVKNRKDVSESCEGFAVGMFLPTILYVVVAITAAIFFIGYLLYLLVILPSMLHLHKLASTTPDMTLLPPVEMFQIAKRITKCTFVFQVNWFVLWPPLLAALWILHEIKEWLSSKMKK
jgi:hypothetical protein